MSTSSYKNQCMQERHFPLMLVEWLNQITFHSIWLQTFLTCSRPIQCLIKAVKESRYAFLPTGGQSWYLYLAKEDG